MHTCRFPAAIALLSMTLAVSPAGAQSADPAPDDVTTDVTTVKVTGVRDPAMMPYKEAHEFLSRIDKVGGDRVNAVIRVLSSKTKKPIAGLDIALQGDQTFEKIPVADNGVVTVPLDERLLADHAEFVTNQRKGSLGAHIALLPRLPADQFTYGDVQASMDAGKRVIRELVPWYLRLFVGTFKAVAICYPDKGRTVQVSNSTTPDRPAMTEHWDTVQGRQVFCADFAAGERGIAKDSVITAPPGWRAIFVD